MCKPCQGSLDNQQYLAQGQQLVVPYHDRLNISMMDGDSTSDLQEGAELTISYIDINLPVSARRRELQHNFFFLCRCFR